MATIAPKPTKLKLSPSELAKQLVDADGRPALVGTTEASKLLGIKPPNFRRDAAPHLTTVPVDGSAAAYFRSEVEQLARDRADRPERRTAESPYDKALARG